MEESNKKKKLNFFWQLSLQKAAFDIFEQLLGNFLRNNGKFVLGNLKQLVEGATRWWRVYFV